MPENESRPTMEKTDDPHGGTVRHGAGYEDLERPRRGHTGTAIRRVGSSGAHSDPVPVGSILRTASLHHRGRWFKGGSEVPGIVIADQIPPCIARFSCPKVFVFDGVIRLAFAIW